MMIGKTLIVAALVGVAGFSLAGCGEKKEASIPAPSSSSEALPRALFVASRPEGALDVLAAKGGAKAGQPIVVRGRVGGGMEPFVDGRAIVTIMDPALPACSDNPGDGCTTPWDYCCEPTEAIAKHAATVRVVNASGAPLRAGLKGAGGLKELSEVIVVGNVAQAEGSVLVIDAKAIHVVGG